MKLTKCVELQQHIRGSDTSKIQWSSLHGERFRMEFDEAFGLLYCDLKILAGAVGVFGGNNNGMGGRR